MVVETAGQEAQEEKEEERGVRAAQDVECDSYQWVLVQIMWLCPFLRGSRLCILFCSNAKDRGDEETFDRSKSVSIQYSHEHTSAQTSKCAHTDADTNTDTHHKHKH